MGTLGIMWRLAIAFSLLTAIAAAQEAPLGDVARQVRARKEAEELANFKPGVMPPLAAPGDIVPAHFITIHGDAGQGELSIKLNDQVLFHNSYVRDLPIYISALLLDGGNTLDVTFTTGSSPLEMTIDERFPHEAQHQVLATFHSDPAASPAAVNKQVHFIAHPKGLPPLQLNDTDRIAIQQMVRTFYNALAKRDGKQVLALFAPALTDARVLYPEGADFAQAQLNRMADMVAINGFEMKPFEPAGLQLVPKGAIVVVLRSDGQPVFTSNEVTLPNGNTSSVSAETIPLKKIAGQWRLTLPFGF